MKTKIAIRNLILGNIILSPFNLASAAGFAVMEQTVTGLGTAFAGGSAAAADSSTVFYNPAGMSKLSGTRSAAGLHFIMPKSEFSDSGSSGLFGSIPGSPSDEGGEEAIVTNFYLTSQVSDSIHLGLGINAPFGLATKYHDDWVGRYHGITSTMQTVNINPSISFSFLDGQLSVGFGFSAQYLHLRLTNAVDYGTICVGALGRSGQDTATAVNTCGGLGLAPQTRESDGIAKINGDSWGYGGNVGLLYEPVPGTRVGLAYRSHMRHTVKGEARFDNTPAGFLALQSDAFQTTNAQGNLDLPETISFSLFHQINNQWALMGDISWTNWDRFETLIIDFDNPSQPATEIEQKWDDVFRYALGVAYTPSAEWTFRAGTSYEETPVASADFRTPRIPDNSRYWLSIGASYSPFEQLTIDFAYTHVFMHNSEINNTDSLGHTLKGTFSTDADIVSAQARWVF